MTVEIIDSAADKPIIVLVPHAFTEAPKWGAVVAGLKGGGFSAVVADNPHEGLESDTGVLLDLLRRLDGPIVLVGHAYGGMLISNVACASLDVQALVYVAALAPEKGETLGKLLGGLSEAAAEDAAIHGVAGDPGWELLPSWFVYGDADERIPAALHAHLAARAGAVETVVLRVIDMAVQATIAQVPDITPD
jgi:Alpha/beta hydrolase family